MISSSFPLSLSRGEPGGRREQIVSQPKGVTGSLVILLFSEWTPAEAGAAIGVRFPTCRDAGEQESVDGLLVLVGYWTLTSDWLFYQHDGQRQTSGEVGTVGGPL